MMTFSLEPGMALVALIHTVSGSTYVVSRRLDGSWWCCAWNVPSARSSALAGTGWWSIAPPAPWPPVIGETLFLLPPGALRRDDPARMPGGGKCTSAVMKVMLVEREAPTDASASQNYA
jgi:hypothetical protein